MVVLINRIRNERSGPPKARSSSYIALSTVGDCVQVNCFPAPSSTPLTQEHMEKHWSTREQRVHGEPGSSKKLLIYMNIF
jgi:hypothetical protein